MTTKFPDSTRATLDHLEHPRPGMVFTEFMAHYVFVLHSNNGIVVWMTANAPCSVPADGTVHIGTNEEFVDAFTTTAAERARIPWVRAVEPEIDCTGWIPEEIEILLQGGYR